jgi:hypothetical protein
MIVLVVLKNAVWIFKNKKIYNIFNYESKCYKIGDQML